MAKTREKQRRLEMVVHGRVQGVAFRYYTRTAARQLGVTGWVRNLSDGSVRIVAEGTSPGLETFLSWVSRGPDHARVDRVDTHWSDAAGGFAGFNITG